MSGHVPEPPSPAVRWSRRMLVAAGLALAGFGAWTAWSTVPSGQWASAFAWLAGGVVVHDVVLAPLAVGAGALVLPRAPTAWRAPLRGGLLAAGALAVLAVAQLAGAADRHHWSVVPQEPVTAVTTAVLVVVAGVVLGVVVTAARAGVARRRLRARRAGAEPRPSGRPPPTGPRR